MGTVKTYNPKDIVITFGGYPLTGFADGTFLMVAPKNDRFTPVSGADGEAARAKSNDKTYEVTLTLLQTSLSNNYLSGILALDDISNEGKLPLLITDVRGTTLFSFLQAWIRIPPTSEFSKEISNREWIFDTGQADVENIGGNL